MHNILPASKEKQDDSSELKVAQKNLAHLYAKTMRLYTMNENFSISKLEAKQLADSISFVLGLNDISTSDAIKMLTADDIDTLYAKKLHQLDTRIDKALEIWKEICLLMPPINNISLRDTLKSIGNIKHCYDIHFCAHEIPCNIDYQLSKPISESLQGIDYIQAWLNQLLKETKFIAQFTPKSCISALEKICPDYKGLHINLYDLLKICESDLEKTLGTNL